MIRIPWDKYEIAILIEASEKVIHNISTTKEIVTEVSNILRQRAINNGVQIDDLFRNKNGIRMQITIMISLLQNKNSPLHNASKLFQEMVEIYKKDKFEFDLILSKAKLEADLCEESNDIIKKEGLIMNDKSKDYILRNNDYIKILETKFPRGFRLNDSLDIKKFRRYWADLYGEENQLSNEVIWENIRNITILHGNLSYLPESMIDNDTKEKIFSYIKETLSSGISMIYYDALYQTFKDELDNNHINNIEMLITYLKHVNNNNFVMKKDYLCLEFNMKIDISEELKKYLITCALPCTIESIIKDLSYISGDKIKQTLSGHNSYEFARNKKGEFFHADIIDIFEVELNKIQTWIDESIMENNYMSRRELIKLIKDYIPEIYDRYPFLTELGLYNTIAYKLIDKFSFRGKIISKYGEELQMKYIFQKFAKNHVPFTLEQLSALADDLDTPIYMEIVCNNAMRVSKNLFVSRNEANFDVFATDNAIEQFCDDDFISLQEINLFGGFPSCNFSWNSFLLEYYVMYYSERFKLLHMGFNKTKSVGAIVKRNSGIETFNDVIIKALAHSNIELNANNALEYLCNAGYIARRCYESIYDIVNKAKAQREVKGD